MSAFAANHDNVNVRNCQINDTVANCDRQKTILLFPVFLFHKSVKYKSVEFALPIIFSLSSATGKTFFAVALSEAFFSVSAK